MLCMEFIVQVSIFTVLLECTVSGWFACPKHCDCSEGIVDCSNRGLKEFPKDFPFYTSTLNLSGNGLHYFPDGGLPGLQNLAHLNLGLNQLHFIPEATFKEQYRLETLNLSGNKFRRLSDIRGIYQAYNLQQLDISNNPIIETGSCLPEYSLYSESVYKLDLSKGILTTINPCAFLWLNNLTHLYLSGNPIQQLTQIISESIVHLDVSSCDIHYVTPQAFDKLPSLKYLDLSRNPNLKIHTPLNEMYMSPSLLHLDVSNCGLTEIMTSFFPNLEYASFRGNFIRELPPQLLHHNQQLTTLDLSENLISITNYATFFGADSLAVLDISSNFITDFSSGTFAHMFQLKKLKLSRNFLKTLANISAPSLQYLDVSDCDITELQSLTIFHMPDLLSLNVSNNPIEYLPEDLRFENLKELDLSYCRITTIHRKTFKNLTTLKRLDLRGNRLTNVFRKPILESMVNIKEILVTNNPWLCNCNMTNHHEFINFVVKRSPGMEQQDLTCLFPDSQIQVLWSKACQVPDEKEVKRLKSDRQWAAFLITFTVMTSVITVLLVLRHNMAPTPAHVSQENVNDTESNETSYPTRSPIADILQLPTYEEAILLPKPTHLHCSNSSNLITREASTWTSTHNLENYDNDHNDNNDDNSDDNDDTDNCSISIHQEIENFSSTSI